MATFKSYFTGFITSIILTLVAYYFVHGHTISHHHMYAHSFLIWMVLILAITQLVVQLIFFLHLGKGQDSNWNLVVFFSTLSIVLILVIGSLWIMNHLNYNMTPTEMNNYMMKSEGMHK